MTAKLVTFTGTSVQDIPGALRTLADQIAAGEFGDAHELAWVIDCGDCRLEIGLLGAATNPAASAHFLLHLGMQKLIQAVLP